MIGLYLMGASIHLDDDYDYNNNHYLVAVESGNYIAGGFKNSYDNLSIIGGRKFEFESNYINYGAIVGAVSGYDDWQTSINYGGISPIIAPYIEFKTTSINPVVMVFGNAITLTFKIDLYI